MGKHAQYIKRGTAAGQGYLAAPLAADWTLGVPASVDCPASLVISIPAGADRWGVMAIKVSNSVPVPVNVSVSGPNLITPLALGTPYRAVAAWFSTASNKQVSDWSPPKLFTTLP